MILVAGLGNPGAKYARTRHNAGFMLIDKLVAMTHAKPVVSKKAKGLLYETADFVFLKPQTFMNASGESVSPVFSMFNVSRLIVVHDDLDLSVGALRFKLGGASGGHNGLKSIDFHLGADYTRVRIGISRPQDKDDVISYVLSSFTASELETLEPVLDCAAQAVLSFKDMDLPLIQSRFTLKAAGGKV
ncbi:MAG: aminoacyl-tRNA hydrolase [Helicobacteraceae bacterium]